MRVNWQVLAGSTAGVPLNLIIKMLNLPQPLLQRDDGFSLARLVDANLLPVLLERGEQPFVELFSSLNLESTIDPLELVSLGSTRIFAYGQCNYLDSNYLMNKLFEKLWERSLKETEMLKATYFKLEAVLHQWHGHIGHDYGFELDAVLEGYMLKNALS